MCNILGIQANSSQDRNRDLCEYNLGLSLSRFDLTGIRGLKIALRMNLELGPRFAQV